MYPRLIEGYITETYLKRAIESNEIIINIINQRLSEKNLSNIYDAPFGHGPGIIMRVDNFYKNMKPYLNKNCHTIIFSPKGKKLTQLKLYELGKQNKTINLICSRFEGYDKRIEDYCDDVISLGDYVISGGEIAALVLIEGIYRLFGKEIKNKSIIEESFGKDGHTKMREHDQYTRPRIWKDKKVPEVLYSGHHKKIEDWKKLNKSGFNYNKRS